MEKQKRTYSPEFKTKAVELCNHRGNLQSVAAELDVSAKNLSRWKQGYEAGKLDGSNRKPAVTKSAEQLENIALRKALRDAELERDILKKALSIFSKSDR
jgi:transposase